MFIIPSWKSKMAAILKMTATVAWWEIIYLFEYKDAIYQMKEHVASFPMIYCVLYSEMKIQDGGHFKDGRPCGMMGNIIFLFEYQDAIYQMKEHVSSFPVMYNMLLCDNSHERYNIYNIYFYVFLLNSYHFLQ